MITAKEALENYKKERLKSVESGDYDEVFDHIHSKISQTSKVCRSAAFESNALRVFFTGRYFDMSIVEEVITEAGFTLGGECYDEDGLEWIYVNW